MDSTENATVDEVKAPQIDWADVLVENKPVVYRYKLTHVPTGKNAEEVFDPAAHPNENAMAVRDRCFQKLYDLVYPKQPEPVSSPTPTPGPSDAV